MNYSLCDYNQLEFEKWDGMGGRTHGSICSDQIQQLRYNGGNSTKHSLNLRPKFQKTLSVLKNPWIFLKKNHPLGRALSRWRQLHSPTWILPTSFLYHHCDDFYMRVFTARGHSSGIGVGGSTWKSTRRCDARVIYSKADVLM